MIFFLEMRSTMALMMICFLELIVRLIVRGDIILFFRILFNCFFRFWKLCVRVKLLNMNVKRNIWSLSLKYWLLVFSIYVNWIFLVNICWYLFFRNYGIWMNIIFLIIIFVFLLYILFCFYLKYNIFYFIKDFENFLLF